MQSDTPTCPPQPWLAPFDAALCHAVLHAVAQGGDALPLLNAALAGRRNAQGLALRCVPQAELPPHMAYETFIFDTGCIPTRTVAGSNGALHDACNALTWVHFPRSKNVLNALQATAIAADGIQGVRGRLRDALTLFDESALILCHPAGDPAPQQLAKRQWAPLLHTRRGDWHTQLKPYLFGHAVLQKLQTPYPAITAQVFVLPLPQSSDLTSDLASVDAAIAARLQAAHGAHALTPQAFSPLPVLGIPGWWAGNEAAAFYDDARVFRR